MECCNDKDLLIEPHPLEDTVLDIDTPSSQMAIMSLPNNQIRTMSDIETLKKYVAFVRQKSLPKIVSTNNKTKYKLWQQALQLKQ